MSNTMIVGIYDDENGTQGSSMMALTTSDMAEIQAVVNVAQELNPTLAVEMETRTESLVTVTVPGKAEDAWSVFHVLLACFEPEAVAV